MSTNREKVAAMVSQLNDFLNRVEGAEASFKKEREVAGVRYLTADLTLYTHSPAWVHMDNYAIYRRPSARMTVQDVRALRDTTCLAMMRGVVVVVSRDSFEPQALSSIGRSKWIDYFDGTHVPERWTAAAKKEEKEEGTDPEGRPPG